jgi:hypothetical protein
LGILTILAGMVAVGATVVGLMWAFEDQFDRWYGWLTAIALIGVVAQAIWKRVVASERDQKWARALRDTAAEPPDEPR